MATTKKHKKATQAPPAAAEPGKRPRRALHDIQQFTVALESISQAHALTQLLWRMHEHEPVTLDEDWYARQALLPRLMALLNVSQDVVRSLDNPETWGCSPEHLQALRRVLAGSGSSPAADGCEEPVVAGVFAHPGEALPA